MAQVYVSIGSNIDRERSVRAGVAELRDAFGELTLSSVYESEAVGFEGDNFFNLVAGFDTDMPVEEVAALLRQIEDRHGRVRTGPRFSSRTLDIDLLLYDDLVIETESLCLPRDEITKNAFVLWPLAELISDQAHPVLKRAYGELWDAFDKGKQPLWPVTFSY